MVDGDFPDAPEPPAAPGTELVRTSAGIVDVSPEAAALARRWPRSGSMRPLVIALIPLGLVIGETIVQGVQVLSVSFFTGLPPLDPSNTAGAGISNALVGTLIMVGIGHGDRDPAGS